MTESTRLIPGKRSLDREIWELLWPLLVLTAIQRIGHSFEGILVSVNSTDELTITSLCVPYISLITTVSYGLGIGTNAFVARLFADGLWEKCCRRATKLVLLVLVAGSFCMSAITAMFLLSAFSQIPELASKGWLYMLPYLFGSPILLLFQLLLSALRGFRDTKTGMWMTVLSMPVQLFVSWLGYTLFGIAGLGYGTLMARGAGCLLGLHKIRKHFPAEGGKDALPKGSTKDFLALAVPVSLSKGITPAAHAAVNPLVLALGSVYVSASGLGGRLESYFYLPAMSIGSVAITLAAGENRNCSTKKLITRLCLWSMTPSVLMAVAAWIFAEPVWGMLTPDPALQGAGVEYWRICLLAYPLISLEMTITGILQAKGEGMPALVISAVRTWGVQLPITWAAVQFGWGPKGAWMGFLMGNLASVLIIAIWAHIKLKKPVNKEKIA